MRQLEHTVQVPVVRAASIPQENPLSTNAANTSTRTRTPRPQRARMAAPFAENVQVSTESREQWICMLCGQCRFHCARVASIPLRRRCGQLTLSCPTATQSHASSGHFAGCPRFVQGVRRSVRQSYPPESATSSRQVEAVQQAIKAGTYHETLRSSPDRRAECDERCRTVPKDRADVAASSTSLLSSPSSSSSSSSTPALTCTSDPVSAAYQ